MKTKNAIVGLMVSCLAGGAAYAAPAVSGFIETSYNYNLFIPVASTSNGAFHAYDAQTKTFTLNTAHLDMSGSDAASGLGYDIQTDFGSDAQVNEPNTGVGIFDVQEAYATYAFGAGKAWGLKAGKYATYEGIEVVEGGSNPTISRGLLYWLAEPVTHTGAEVSYADKMWDVHVGLVNGWDLIQDNNNMPSLIAKFGLYMGDPLTLSVSAIVGSENAGAAGNTKTLRESFDVTAVNKSVKMVDLNFQVNYGMQAQGGLGAGNLGTDATWLGLGVQPYIHLDDNCGVGLRYEFFNDANGARTGLKRTLQNISVAPTYWITKNLESRVEYRLDLSNQTDFAGKKNQSIVSADLIASF